MFTGSDVLVARQRLGLSRTKFATLVGPPMTPTKVSNIEHGREIRPEEQAVLAAHVTGSIESAVDVPLPSEVASTSTAVFLLDEDEEVMLLESTAPVDEVPPSSSQPLNAATLVSPQPAGTGVAAPSLVVSPAQPAGSALNAPSGPGEAATTSISTNGLNPVGHRALNRSGLRRVSNSEIQTFKRCRRQWWLAWYRGLRLKLEKHTGALAIGDRVHRALAAYYQPADQPRQDPREALEEEITRDELLLVHSIADHDTIDAAETLVAFKQDADLARAMVEGYVDWLAETGSDQGYRVEAPEQQLSMIVLVPRADDEFVSVEVIGRLDVRLVREHDQVRLWMDHKTTGNFEKLTRLLVWDEQMKTYHLLEEANRSAGAPRVEGALYNMLRKVKRSQTAKPPFYQRVELQHNVHEIATFKTRLLGEIEQILDAEDALNEHGNHQWVAYPTPGDHCLWGCAYSAVCVMFDDGSRVEDFIEQHYIAGNPLDRYDDLDEMKETI